MPGKTVLGADVAKTFLNDLSKNIREHNIEVKCVSFLANSDPAAEKYAEWAAKSCAETGVKFEVRRLNRENLEDTILQANDDDEIHGIMVYYPVFGGGHDQYIQNCVSIYKDVEGLSHLYRFNMYHNIRFLNPKNTTQKNIIPCTPLGIIKTLEYCNVYNKIVPHGNQLHGKIITIINRSEVIGRPLAALLANDGAKVYSIDLNDVLEFHRGSGLTLRKHVVVDSTMKLEQVLPISDVVVTGVPSKTYRVPTQLLKEGVVAINFSSWKNFEDDILNKASIYIPSVGKVTVTMLQRNLIRLRHYQIEIAKIESESVKKEE